jgi:hypothetical protein
MYRWTLILIVTLMVPPSAHALSSATQSSNQAGDDMPFVLTRLGLDLHVDYARGTISGSATLQIRNAADRPSTGIPILLNRLMTVTRIVDATGADVPFEQRIVVYRDDSIRQVNAILVTPRHPTSPGDSLTIAVHYGGILVGYTETGSLYIQDHVSRDFTIIREDAYAFPTLGVPSWNATRVAVRGQFTFTARVTTPADLMVAMGGEPAGQTRQDSTITWIYRSTAPVPFLNITVAPYRLLERAGARIFYFAADSSGAEMVARAVAGAVERYTRWYGPLFQEPRVVVMEIPEGFGSQASLAAGILQTADAFRTRSELPQLYHELSHLWNVPDLDRPSPRWNEGLAMFLQWRMAAELDGWADWDARLDRTAQSLMGGCREPVPCDSVPFVAFGRAGLTDRSYALGMLMFYELYQVLGADSFDRAYRAFFQRYQTQGARNVDLISAFHHVSDKSDRVLADWFSTTRWHMRLAAGESVQQMVAAYRRP